MYKYMKHTNVQNPAKESPVAVCQDMLNTNSKVKESKTEQIWPKFLKMYILRKNVFKFW